MKGDPSARSKRQRTRAPGDDSCNLIQRNACSGNGTNWVIAAGNTANVIVAAKSPSSEEAPNGVPLGSNDPLVNYTF
jgi:hypothetical protein